MKKTFVLAIIAIFVFLSAAWAGKTIMNAPGGKRTSAQLTNTMAFPLDSGTADYWTDLAEHYAWVKAQMDVLYASKPWYDGAAITGSVIKFYGPTVANGGHGTYTSIQGADYVGDEGTGIQWRLPITYPATGVTGIIKTDDVGNMAITSVTGNSKYLGTNASGTYGIFDLPSGGSMTWPSAAGIPLYSGSSSWGTSLSSATPFQYLRVNAGGSGYEFANFPSLFSGSYADLSNIPLTFAPAAHNHAGSEITSGTVGAAYLPVVGSATGGIVPTTNGVTDGYVIAKQSNGSAAWVAPGGGFTNLTDFDTQTAWRIFYSDGSGDVTELALGSDGEYLKSNGASSAPSWATPSGAAHDAITLSTDLGNNLLGLSTQQITLDSQNANIVFAGPSTGSAAAPSFRSLVADDIPSLATTYAVVTGTPETTFQIDNNDSGPKLKNSSGTVEVRNAADDAYVDVKAKDGYFAHVYSTAADGEYYANFDNTVAITFIPSLGYIWSQSSGGVSTLYFYDGSGSRTVLNSNSTLDDDKVSFDDADNLWTATTIGAALEELNDSINAGAPNGTGAKVHWSQLLGVPAGFADGTDDGGGFSPTTYDDLTWGAAAGGSQTWTWDTGSSTDPTMTVSDSYFTFNKIIQCAGIETTRSATVGGSVRIGYEGSNNGDNYIDIKAPDARDTSLVLLYPTADPSEGQAIAWSAPSTEVSTGTWYTPVKEGTGTGGILLGDASPDTAGEFGYTSNQLSVHDGTASRDVLQVASTTITKTEYIPIAYAEDGSVAPSASAVTASTRKVRTREFSGTADNDVEIHWMVPADYAGGVKFRFVGYVTNATAPADTEVVAFSLAGCSNGNSDVLGCTAGTAQTSSLTADANYVQYDRLSGAYSSAITITDIAAGESAHFKLTRLATTTDTYGQAFGLAGIEIKYQAKVNASGDY